MSSDFERYAVYWVPRCEDSMARFGAHWTGWCSDQGEPHDRNGFAELSFDIPEVTRQTCRHGLHAVLKGPFRLGDGRSRFLLEHSVSRLAESAVALPLPPLRLEIVDGRVSLAPRQATAAIAALVTRIRRVLAPIETDTQPDGFAEPIGPAWFHEHSTVNDNGSVITLSSPAAQPFHIPLTDRLADGTARQVLAELRPVLEPVLAQRRRLQDIALMGDPGEGRPLRLLQRYELRENPVDSGDRALSSAGPELLAPTLGGRRARSGIAV